MSDDDIDKAVKEAAEFEAQDKKRKEAIDTRNEADAMVFQTEKAIKEVGDKVDPCKICSGEHNRRAGSRDQSCEGKTDGERTETVHKDV